MVNELVHAGRVFSVEDWHAVRETTRCLEKASSTLSDQPVGLLKYLGNYRDWTLKRAQSCAESSFEISNLGRFESAQGVDEGGEAKCRIGRMTFSRSTVAFGAALNTSVVSGGDGGLSIGFSWQEGVLEDEVVERVVEGFRKGVEGEGF